MPHPTTEEQLESLTAALHDAFTRLELLDDAGRVPSTPLFDQLMRHADAAKELSRTAMHLAAVVGIPNPGSVVDRESDSKVRAQLAVVTEHTLRAVDLFTRTAEASASGPQRREGQMVVDHASARAELRRAAEATGEALTLLREHAELQRFLASMLRRPTITPPPPQPRPRRTR
ncbi:hypothetical protein [Streptomyces sp. NPDC059076]|uniref:hypothetical protein n=1 Tax=unclassified Streptomyces TaxID=2593676 RepID=UPI0036C4DEF6